MKAQLTNYRQAPRKVRLVADLIKGKKVSVALEQLAFLPKRAAAPIALLLRSAIANAKNTTSAQEGTLFVKNIRVDAGTVLKRMMPRARGSGAQILKRSSTVVLDLEQK